MRDYDKPFETHLAVQRHYIPNAFCLEHFWVLTSASKNEAFVDFYQF